ncbi:ankyrin repeat-containing domain protein, partial [Geopyxis carbonaria]
SVRGHRITVDALLSDGGSDIIDAKGWDGMSSLHLAAMRGRKNTTSLLLKKGARADIQDHFRRNPLHWAAQYGNYRVVERLLQNGAPIDARDDYERTPLHLATLGRSDESI